jgi:hypothetical protein
MATSSQRAGATESARARLLRQAFVRHQGEILAGRLFAFLQAHLGDSGARRLFARFSTRRTSRGRGASNPMQDEELLDMYDAAAEETANQASVPAQLAARLDESEPGGYGNSAEAIAKRIRRLLKKRRQEAEIAGQMRAALSEQEEAYKKLLDESPKKSRDK